ncbi:MAG: enoyl-CoA hydratase/isomerase family protein, partial [Candidatus Ranarchaeia archaeon]
MPETEKTLKVEKEGPLAIITLNRPQVHNAINTKMLQELDDVISMVRLDKTIRVMIITGSGEKSFSSGSDIKELLELDPLQAQWYSKFGQRVFHHLENLEKIVITAVNGTSLGAAIEIIMASDIAVAAENAVFGWPEILLGIIPCWGGTQRLPRIVGKLKAKELIFTGRSFGPDEALQLGLINSIVPKARLMIEAKRIGSALARNP